MNGPLLFCIIWHYFLAFDFILSSFVVWDIFFCPHLALLHGMFRNWITGISVAFWSAFWSSDSFQNFLWDCSVSFCPPCESILCNLRKNLRRGVSILNYTWLNSGKINVFIQVFFKAIEGLGTQWHISSGLFTKLDDFLSFVFFMVE